MFWIGDTDCHFQAETDVIMPGRVRLSTRPSLFAFGSAEWSCALPLLIKTRTRFCVCVCVRACCGVGVIRKAFDLDQEVPEWKSTRLTQHHGDICRYLCAYVSACVIPSLANRLCNTRAGRCRNVKIFVIYPNSELMFQDEYKTASLITRYSLTLCR